MEFILGQMGEDMKDNTRMIKEKEKGHLNGKCKES